MRKTEIVARLGESAVLLPSLVTSALAANDRLKLRLSLLQAAAAHAADPQAPTHDFSKEIGECGLDPTLCSLGSKSRAVGGDRFAAPGLTDLVKGIGPDLRTMLAPLETAKTQDCASTSRRLEALCAELPEAEADAIEVAEVARLSGAGQKGPDTVHLLVMDLHQAVNRLAAGLASETLDGAQVYNLAEDDRRRVKAFMRGLNRTSALAFGHPGLGTIAARSGAVLTIQNDIGETGAHVLVVHVDGRLVTVTYTDVHRRRATFFASMFKGEASWSSLGEPANLSKDEVFYLLSGRYEGEDAAAVEAFLELLGSRIVFLIDWNRARKALETLVERDAAIALLAWAADKDLGHRAFVALGGADLVFEAIRRGGEGRIPYGVKLDKALGVNEAVAFLRQVLRETSEGLRAGRSAGLIRDEIQADLSRRFETAEATVLAVLVRHLGLSRTLIGAAQDRLNDSAAESPALAARSKRLEAKGDRLTLEARGMCNRLVHPVSARTLVDAVEDAMDALDEGAFLLSLGRLPVTPGMRRLTETVAEAVGQMVRAAETAACVKGWPENVEMALQALDAVMKAEHDADDAQRAVIADLVATEGGAASALVLGIQTAAAFEAATDHLAHAALALRGRMLEEPWG